MGTSTTRQRGPATGRGALVCLGRAGGDPPENRTGLSYASPGSWRVLLTGLVPVGSDVWLPEGQRAMRARGPGWNPGAHGTRSVFHAFPPLPQIGPPAVNLRFLSWSLLLVPENWIRSGGPVPARNQHPVHSCRHIRCAWLRYRGGLRRRDHLWPYRPGAIRTQQRRVGRPATDTGRSCLIALVASAKQ